MKRATLHEKRSDLRIIYDILTIARKGARKTKIVYGANLNFRVLEEYLVFLKHTELVAEDDSAIKTTERGKRYMEAFTELMNTMSRHETMLRYYEPL